MWLAGGLALLLVAACFGDDAVTTVPPTADGGGPEASATDGASPEVDASAPTACDRAKPFGGLEPVRTSATLSEVWFTPSSDERTAYLVSSELVDGGVGPSTLSEVSRSAPTDPWTTAAAVPSSLNPSGFATVRTAMTGDGKEIYLSSAPFGSGAVEVYVARRASTTVPFSAPERSNLNIPGQAMFFTWIRSDGLVGYFSTAKAGQDITGLDLFRVERGSTSSAFGAPAAVAELDSPAIDVNAVLTDDELELYFTSNRAGANAVYRSRRTTRADGFGAPVIVDELAAAKVVAPVSLSADGCVMYVLTAQPKDAGQDDMFDVWRTRRPK